MKKDIHLQELQSLEEISDIAAKGLERWVAPLCPHGWDFANQEAVG